MDEIENVALNNEAVVENSPTTTPVEETKATEEVSEPTEAVATEPEGETTETGEDIKKRGANQRIRELNDKAKAAEARAESMAEKLEKLTGSVEPSENNTPYQSRVTPGAEITPDQYKQDVRRTADSLVNLRLKQHESIGRIKSESQEAIKKYSLLDPDSENFNEDLSDSVYEAVEAKVRANPYSVSVGKFVDKLMKPYTMALNKEVGKATETIAKQVSEAALKPTATRIQATKAEDKSIEQLEEELGIIQS